MAIGLKMNSAHKTIDNFSGAYQFLSNFYDSTVYLDGVLYSSVEHAYQAAKTLDPQERSQVRSASTHGLAKKLGRKVKMRPGWDNVKLSVMADLVSQKFARHHELRKMLLETGDAELIEGNYWGDVFWGVCKGKGENHLGKILMNLRTSYQAYQNNDN